MDDLPEDLEFAEQTKNVRQGPSECSICYRPAKGYHCGVASCKACKTFFRRIVLSNISSECKYEKNCYDPQRKPNIIFRCQACRFKKCIEVGMNPLALELKDEEKSALNLQEAIKNQQLVSIPSMDSAANGIISALNYTESRFEAFRISAYNPNLVEVGNLLDLIQSASKLSLADQFGPMLGWPIPKVRIISPDVTMKSKIRDIPDTRAPVSTEKKMWMIFNTYATIEYIKTFDFFHQLSVNDKVVLAGHATLTCMHLNMAYFSVSKKIDGCLQPDGSESPQKDESHYTMTAMPLAPLIRCNIHHTEYLLLRAICLCNPTVHGLSEHAQALINIERRKYADLLFDLCLKSGSNGPGRLAQLLGIIPVLEEQQQQQKNFYILYLAPIFSKYDKIAQFIHDIMFL